MKTNQKKYLGLAILLITVGIFFFTLNLFSLVDKDINYSNNLNAVKLLFSFVITIFGLYIGLSLLADKIIAKKMSLALLVFSIISILIGFFRI